MKITDKLISQGKTIEVKDIEPGTVFMGTIYGVKGPWLRTMFSVVNLVHIGATRSSEYAKETVDNYVPREAELILS